jgi:hypothetical protein
MEGGGRADLYRCAQTAVRLPYVATAPAWTNRRLKQRSALRAHLRGPTAFAKGGWSSACLAGESTAIANGGSSSLPSLAAAVGPNRHFRRQL